MRSLCSLWTRLPILVLDACGCWRTVERGCAPDPFHGMLWLASSGGRGGGWLDTPRRDFASNYVIKTPPAALGGPLSTYLGLIRYRANWLPLLSARVSPPPSAPSPSPFLLPSFLPRRERLLRLRGDFSSSGEPRLKPASSMAFLEFQFTGN